LVLQFFSENSYALLIPHFTITKIYLISFPIAFIEHIFLSIKNLTVLYLLDIELCRVFFPRYLPCSIKLSAAEIWHSGGVGFAQLAPTYFTRLVFNTWLGCDVSAADVVPSPSYLILS
jgi:hypothetical protein